MIDEKQILASNDSDMCVIAVDRHDSTKEVFV